MAERKPECRACRCIIPRGRLACKEHWAMLPADLRSAIVETYHNRGQMREYTRLVTQADGIWKEAGVWLPGIPGDIPTRDVMRMRGQL